MLKRYISDVPSFWNKLPQNIKLPSTLSAFNNQLKVQLPQDVYPPLIRLYEMLHVAESHLCTSYLIIVALLCLKSHTVMVISAV